MELADFLVNARHAAGLSQAQLSKRAGVSRSVIAEIETGKRVPSGSRSRDGLIRMAHVLDVDPLRMLELAGHEPRRDERVTRTRPPLEDLIRSEPTLTAMDKTTLLAVLASLRGRQQAGG